MRIFASRQCADYVCASYMYVGAAGEVHAAHVTFAVGPREEKLFVVSKPQWPPTPLSPTSISITKEAVVQISESSVTECVRLCDTHKAYTYGM